MSSKEYLVTIHKSDFNKNQKYVVKYNLDEKRNAVVSFNGSIIHNGSEILFDSINALKKYPFLLRNKSTKSCMT